MCISYPRRGVVCLYGRVIILTLYSGIISFLFPLGHIQHNCPETPLPDHLRSIHGRSKTDAELEDLDRGVHHSASCQYSRIDNHATEQSWVCCEILSSTRTSYEVLGYYDGGASGKMTLVKVKITGGRTHQIRVHMMMLAQKLKMEARSRKRNESAPT